MREIGSEFWYELKNMSNPQEDSEGCLYPLSGRTALDFICKDSKVQSIMLPSYCCDSMIEPFLRNSLTIQFYSIGTDCVVYDFSNDCDAVLLLDYFGYVMPEMIEIAKKEHSRGKVVIYDGTHLLTENQEIHKFVDYSLCSYRKWTYCNFAVLKKHREVFTVKFNGKEHTEYINLRNEAASQKSAYIRGTLQDKSSYLALFSQAEEMLEKDYIAYIGQAVQIDFDCIIEQRRINAEVLIEGLSIIPQIRLFRSCIGAEDTPMFVPILLSDTEIRNQLRQYLIENNIYCPIHWPLSEIHAINDVDRDMYCKELSLVCDQRYDIEDMQREVEVIKKFFEERDL